MFKGLLERISSQQTPEYLFDYKHMFCVNERMMRDYVLQGRFRQPDSFLIACTKDRAGKDISVGLPLEQLANISLRKRRGMNGLFLDDLPEYEDFLLRTQWFSRIEPGKQITVVDIDRMFLIDLRQKDPHAIIRRLPKTYNPFQSDTFQPDKISSERILTSSITAYRLEELIREEYSGKISEHNSF